MDFLPICIIIIALIIILQAVEVLIIRFQNEVTKCFMGQLH